MNVDAIPAELRERPQWVVWRFEDRDGKLTKVPYRVDGAGRASSSDPTTWGSFEAAAAAAETLQAVGIGYVFSEDDPYVGIDLDDLGADAAAVMLTLDSYAERSVSGRGAHVIVKARLNGYPRHRSGPLEIYDMGRYFVVTGDHIVGTPETIMERQAELEQVLAHFLPATERAALPMGTTVHTAALPMGTAPPVDVDDQELIDKAMRARNGATFERLWNGDTSGHGDDDSAADLALCSHLAFWTDRDHGRIDRLFQASGLMRQKWLRADYRDRTIETAITGCRDTYPGRTRGQKSVESVTEKRVSLAEGRRDGLTDSPLSTRHLTAPWTFLRLQGESAGRRLPCGRTRSPAAVGGRRPHFLVAGRGCA